ncbi:MAG: methionine biosynthesis protein MetW [Anaerolineae bacterium]|nr:methionine biosynthesis protein MetW [Anaerolineae bacterium]
MDLVDYYDAYWKEKGDRVNRQRLDRLAAYIQPGERVLALDCGAGVMARKLADKGAEVIGVDMSHVAVARTREKGIEAYQVDLDMEPLPFPDASFDTVLSDSGLEHRFHVHRALDEAVRVLRPGGRLILSLPNLGHWRCRLWLLMGRFPYVPDSPTDWTHLRFFTLREGITLLRARGVTIEARDGTASLRAWQFYPFCLRWPVVRDIYTWLARRWPSLFARDFILIGRKPGQE